MKNDQNIIYSVQYSNKFVTFHWNALQIGSDEKKIEMQLIIEMEFSIMQTK